jgi:hypothetical protein
MKKTETIAEFLARGGVIKKIATSESTVKQDSVKSTTGGGPAVIVSMGQAELYYGEYKPKKTKKKAIATIDVSQLPEELRKKYIDGVVNGQKDEDSEEDEFDGFTWGEKA